MLNKNAFILLMYLGALPFVAGALLSLLPMDSLSINTLDMLPWQNAVKYAVSLYALVIVVFMAGVLWGLMLSAKASASFSQANFLISNVITLAPWFVYLMVPDSSTFLLVTAFAFLWLLTIDKKLFKQQLITKNYYRARKWVSAIVVLSLLILAAGMH